MYGNLWPTLYSKIFGYAIMEGITFTEKYVPQGKYWTNVSEMERQCLCERDIARISPPISPKVLEKDVVVIRKTGNKWRHEWDWDQKSTTKMPKQNALDFLQICKIKVISLMNDSASIQSNCSTQETLINCELKTHVKCIYENGLPPHHETTYNKETDVLMRLYYRRQDCKVTDNYRWVSVCSNPGCTPLHNHPSSLQCCDLSNSFFYGMDSYEWRTGYSSPCCINGKTCFNYDIQRVWIKGDVICSVTKLEMAFKPISTDVLIQENFYPFSAWNRSYDNFQKSNKQQCIEAPLGLRLISPKPYAQPR